MSKIQSDIESSGEDRRKGDRRVEQVPFDGVERRKADNRSGADRRQTERRNTDATADSERRSGDDRRDG